MIVSFILCSFRSIFDNFVLSLKQNPLFCLLCKLKSGILHSLILFYDYFEHFATFIYFLKPSIQAKSGALTEVTFFILLSLYTPKRGYAIMQFIENETKGRLLLGAGT